MQFEHSEKPQGEVQRKTARKNVNKSPRESKYKFERMMQVGNNFFVAPQEGQSLAVLGKIVRASVSNFAKKHGFKMSVITLTPENSLMKDENGNQKVGIYVEHKEGSYNYRPRKPKNSNMPEINKMIGEV